MLFYSAAGLVFASEIPLPGRNPLDGATEAFAKIRVGPVPGHISHPAQTGAHWALNEAELFLSIPGLASFLLVAGREIIVQPAAGRRPEDAAPFLTQNLLGLLMQQRGCVVLRASAVALDGKALLFCGESATGKSTVAAAMAARGHAVLGDDFCTIEWKSDGTPLIHGDGVHPMLWPDSVEAMGLGSAAGAPVRDGCHKYHVALPAVSEGLPLGAIYFLGEDRRIETSQVTDLRGIRATQAIRESAYRPRALVTMEQKRRHFEAGARIAGNEPLFKLARASGFAWLGQGLKAIEAGLGRMTESAPQ